MAENNVFPEIEQYGGKQVINFKQFHGCLGIKQKYMHWFGKLVKEYDFQLGIDFFTNQGCVWITIHMAKELCVIENSNKSWAARKLIQHMEHEQWKRKKLEEEKEEQKPLSLNDDLQKIITMLTKGAWGLHVHTFLSMLFYSICANNDLPNGRILTAKEVSVVWAMPLAEVKAIFDSGEISLISFEDGTKMVHELTFNQYLDSRRARLQAVG